MKTGLVLWALVLSLACPLAAQVPLRPPPDTTRHPTWPGAGEGASSPRHSHPWLGAAVGAAAGGVIGYLAWRPCSGLCFFSLSQGATTALGAIAGGLLGWAVGSSITTAYRAPIPWRVRVGFTRTLGRHAGRGTANAR